MTPVSRSAHEPVIRTATAADRETINGLVRNARLNPTGLDWRRFLVAGDGEELVGVGPIKLHGDGTRELASQVVVPRRQGRSVGAVIVLALLAREASPIFLYCAQGLIAITSASAFAWSARARRPLISAACASSRTRSP